MIGYGAAGMLAMRPHTLAINVVARYIGIGPGGLARAERDAAMLQKRWAAVPTKPVMGGMPTQASYAGLLGIDAERAFKKDMRKYDEQMKEVHKRNARALASMTSSVGIAAGIGAGLVMAYTTKSAVAYDKFAQQLRSNSAFLKGEFKSMTSFSRDWALKTGAHVEDVMMAYRRLTDVGIHWARARAYVRAGTELGLGTGANIQDVINTIRQTQGTFRFRGRQAAPMWIANQLHVAGQLGSVTQQQLATLYPRVALQSSLAGPKGFQQSLAMWSALSRVAPVAQATSSTQGFFRMLLQPSPAQLRAVINLYRNTGGREDLSKYFGVAGFRRYGVQGLLGALHRMPGTETQREEMMRVLFPQVRGNLAVTALMGNQRAGFTSILGAMRSPAQQRAMGVQTPGQSFNNYLKTSASQMSRVREQLHLLSIDMGHTFIPVLNDAIPVVRSLVNFLGLIAKNRGLTTFIIKAALAFAGASIAFRAVNFALLPMIGLFRKGDKEMSVARSSMIGVGRAARWTAEGLKTGVIGLKNFGLMLFNGGKAALLWARQQVAAVVQVARAWAARLWTSVTTYTRLLLDNIVAAGKWLVTTTVSLVKAGASWLLYRANIIAVTVAQNALAIATKAYTAAVWLLDAAMTAIDANPIGLTIAAIAGLAVGVVALYNNWKPFHNFVNAAWARLKAFAGWIGKVLHPVFRSLGTFIGSVLHNIIGRFQAFSQMLTGGPGAIIQALLTTIKNNWLTILTIFTGPLAPILLFVEHKWGPQITKLIGNVMNAIGSKFSALTGMAGRLKTGLGTLISKAFSPMSTLVKGIAHWVGVLFSKMSDLFHLKPPGWLGGLMDKISNIFGGGGGAPGFSGGGGGWNGRAAGLGGAFGFASQGFANSGVESGNVAMYRALGIRYSGKLLDWDYTGGSQGIRLPGNRRTAYQYIRSLTQGGPQGHMGTAEFFRTPNGGIVQVNHMSVTPNFRPGQIVRGGSYIGQTGYSSGQYGNGYHLCVVTDDRGRTYLAALPQQQFNSAVTNGQALNDRVRGYSPIITAAARATRIPANILASLIQSESSGNANALSSAGAMGLTQLMPATARQYGARNPYNAQQNIFAGARYLAYLYYGPAHRNWTVALAMYNAGPGNPGASAPSYASTILSRANTLSSGGGGAPIRGSGGPPGPYSNAYPPGQGPLLTSAPVKPRRYAGEHYIDQKTGHHMLVKAQYNQQGQYMGLVTTDLNAVKDQVGDVVTVGGKTYRVEAVVTHRNGETIISGTHRVLISGGAYKYQRGDIRLTGGHRYEYEPTTISRMNAQGQRVSVAGPLRWVRLDQPQAGSTQWSFVGGQWVEQRYYPNVGGPGGHWATIPGTGYISRLQQQQTLARVTARNMTAAYPTTMRTANMTPREAAAWLHGRYAAINAQRTVAIDQLRVMRAQGRLPNMTQAQFNNLVQQTSARYNPQFQAARNQLESWQFGGPQTGMYRAYHVFRRDQCAAEAAANKHRAQQTKHQKNIEDHTRVTAVSTTAMNQRLRAIHGEQVHTRRKAASTSPHHKPMPHPGVNHHTPFNDSRYHGHNTHPSPTQ